MADSPTPSPRRPEPLRIHVPFDPADRLRGEQVAWTLEALMARAGVRDWQLVDAPDAADLVFPHDSAAWQFTWDLEPEEAADPIAFAFWWLARVEELLAPPEAFDEHGRFTYAASALARGGDPLATPVDELALALEVGDRARSDGWSIVATHDIDLTWRWTPRGVRRGVKGVLRAVRSGQVGTALAGLGALLAIPYWRLRRDDPWSNAARIRRLEFGLGARSTSYVLTDHHVPADGEPEMHRRGRDRYVAGLVEGGASRRRRRGGAASAAVGLHGSYTVSTNPGMLARERTHLERLAGGEVRDHRYHYLRYRPTEAWPELAAAGITSDATLGYAEQPGFRAGTAHPYRAWDHERGVTLDLVVLPLALMDASLDDRYLGVGTGPEAAELVARVLGVVQRVGGSASVLFHNDRLCTVETGAWTRLYRRLLTHVRASGGSAFTAREAAIGYRTRIPGWRLEP